MIQTRTVKSRSRRSSKPRPFKFKWHWLLLIVLIISVGIYVSWLDIKVREHFEGKRWALPARVYASPLEIYPGMSLTVADLVENLEAIGYRSTTSQIWEAGQYLRKGQEIFIMMRAFKFWDATDPSRLVQVRFAKDLVDSIFELQPYRQVALLRLEPRLIGKIYPTHYEDRILVKFEEVPPLLIKALIAMEDRTFFEHFGISMRGLMRASVENLKAGEVVQGGSTITQQLVKNFFLTSEKTFERKINEALMALLLEWHYSKEQILEAYLNEVFLGQDGDRAVHGMGMAAWFYFNRPLEELKLPELALLVSLIRGPSIYNPRLYPDRAWQRRNMVLEAMVEQNMINREQAEVTKTTPLGVGEKAINTVFPYPAFIELVRRQLRRDYREEDLRSEGLQIFTTLNLFLQKRAEKAFIDGVRKLERANRGARNLQGAMVVTGSENGEVVALVNGKNPHYAGFNRPLDAQRPIGSLIKVAVYLTALEDSRNYNLSTVLDDSPYQWRDRVSGEIWKPQNYDFRSHGHIPLLLALANSYNLATVRLGMQLGLKKIRKTLHELGVEREFEVYPSLLLGSLSLTPLEVTQMYQTIASGGFKVPVRAIRDVLTHEGNPLQRYPLSVEPSFDAAPIFLLNFALQQAVRIGTGRNVAQRFSEDRILAGKTGTSNDLRDSWFAGFDSDWLTVTWVGRDDNKPMGLSGGTGAMVIWGDFMQAVHPRAVPPTTPHQVEWRWVEHGNYKLRVPFIVNHVSTLADGSWFK